MYAPVFFLYLGYYVVLLGVLLAQLQDATENYTNWGTAVVTFSHFMLGLVDVRMSGKSLWEKSKERYGQWYNAAADVFSAVAFGLSVLSLIMYWKNQSTWSAYVPIAFAAVGNTGCSYGRYTEAQATTVHFLFEAV